MKRFKIIISILMLTVFCIVMEVNYNVIASASENNTEFDNYYKNAVYGKSLILGDEIKENGISFIDGDAMGITDQSELYYNERVVLDGIDARKQYRSNNLYLNIDESIGNNNDEYIISIMFYDFGPSEGRYYLEYHREDGTAPQITVVKPGTNPGWIVRSYYMNDLDLSNKYDNGSNFRIINGAYNAFKKIEIINLSRYKEEHKAVDASCIGCTSYGLLKNIGLLDENSSFYSNFNLSEDANMYDVWSLINNMKGQTIQPLNNAMKQEKITQGELLKLFFKQVNLDLGSDPISAATKSELISSTDLFVANEATATQLNLLNLAYTVFYYRPDGKISLASMLVEKGFFKDVDVMKINDDKFLASFYAVPTKCPSVSITDSDTGRTFKYINFFGNGLWRPYVTASTWSRDGKKFICGTQSGVMFIYNIETECLTFIDDGVKTAEQRVNATMGEDDCIYYVKTNDSFWKADIHTLEKKQLFKLPEGCVLYTPSVTNDCRYVSFELYDNSRYNFSAPGESIIGRYDLVENKFAYWTHKFPTEPYNSLNHTQINPEYPNLIYFAHESSGQPNIRGAEFIDRQWILNTDTGEKNTFVTNSLNYKGKVAIYSTHELWSANGEYLYFVNLLGHISNYESIMGPCVMRINKDGTHLQTYYTKLLAWGAPNHTGISGDDRYLMVDMGNVQLYNMETMQTFPICFPAYNVSGYTNHPNNPHPISAKHAKIFDWGYVNKGVIGIAWFDYSELEKNEVAKGGRYKLGEYADYISYVGLNCEVKETAKNGRTCIKVPKTSYLYLDINEKITDSSNDAIRVTFDYLTEKENDIKVTYTGAVKENIDFAQTQNKSLKIRGKSNGTWKKGSFIIDEGNFQNPGEYSSDLKISGGIYISNLKIERIERNE